MKVLKKGSGAGSWSRKCKCTGAGNGGGGCRAVLLVEKSDLFYTYRSFMGRDEEFCITFQCPQCGVKTDIQAPFMPTELPSERSWRTKKNK